MNDRPVVPEILSSVARKSDRKIQRVHRLKIASTGDAERIAEIQNTVTERTEVALVSPADLPDMLRNNEIDHALDAMTLWRFLFERECC